MRHRPLPAVPPLGHYGLPLLSAILLSLAFYPACLDGLVWVACAPLLFWLCHPAVTTRQACCGLWLVGTVYHLILLAPLLSLSWWGWGTTTQEGLRAYFTYQHVFLLTLFSVLAAWGGVVVAGVGWLIRPALTRPLLSCFVVPSAWVLLLEFIGHRTVFGLTWGLVGNRVHAPMCVRQLASATGVYGLSFLVLWVNALLAAWGVWWQRAHARPPIAPTVLTVGMFMAVVWYGSASMSTPLTPANAQQRVALLQGARIEYTQEEFTGAGLDRLYAPMIHQAAQQGADVIILPETVWLRMLTLDKGEASPTHQTITPNQLQQALVLHTGTPAPLVILGLDVASGGRTYNAMTFWDRSGLLGLYRKQRLVPFAEYRPRLVGWLAPQNRIHGPQFAYEPGGAPELIRAAGILYGPFICQEVMFPDLVRRLVLDGAQVLVTTGNDGVFRNPAVAREQALLAQLRAVEHGRYLVRSMKSGISAVIDPLGRVVASAPIGAQAIVSAEVSPISRLTPYTRFGDWIVWLSAVVVMLALIARGLGWSALQGERPSSII